MSDEERKVTTADLLNAVRRVTEEYASATTDALASAKIYEDAELEARKARIRAVEDQNRVERVRAVLARLITAKVDQRGCYTDGENSRRVEVEPALIWPDPGFP